MNKIILTLIATAAISCNASTSTETSAVKDTTYILSSFPLAYDEFGNCYGMDTVLNHPPTHEDSIYFKQSSDQQITRLMDSMATVLEVK